MIKKELIIKLYNKLKYMFGVKHQDSMLIEESCELTVSIKHFHRGKCTLKEVVKELSDVDILKEQFLLNHGCKEMFEIEKEKKQLRTIKRLEEGTLK